VGEGAFGKVLKGKLQNEKFPIGVPVAVKVMKDLNNVEMLLTELKIMIFIGHHENISELIGACTATLASKGY